MGSEVLQVDERGLEEVGAGDGEAGGMRENTRSKERREVALALLCSLRQDTALPGS